MNKPEVEDAFTDELSDEAIDLAKATAYCGCSTCNRPLKSERE
jgi:hypothetical protein